MSQDRPDNHDPSQQEGAQPTPPPEEPPQYGVRLPEGQTPQQPNQPESTPSPYGQNPGQYPPPPPGAYGQAPGGQGGYGQPSPYGQPGGYQQPAGGMQPPATPGQPPKQIMIAFGLILAAGALTLISGIILLLMPVTELATILDEVYSSDPMLQEQLTATGLSVEAIAQTAKTFGFVFIVIGVLLYALIAFFIRRGSNGARITGTVLAAISLFGLLSGGDPLSILTILLGVAGIVMAWLAPSSAYIKAVKEAKRWRR